MRIGFRTVPPGGGEGDYWIFCELPAVPRVGDYVTALPSEDGISAGSGEPQSFVVRAVWWNTTYFKEGEVRLQDDDGICVVVEEAQGVIELEKNRAKFGRYRAKGLPVVTLDPSGY